MRPSQRSRPGWAAREVVPLALAPPASDPRRQRFVRSRVGVSEQQQPEYALVFEAECSLPDSRQAARATRSFSKRQLARAFEQALATGSDAKEAPTNVLGASVQRENLARDAAVRRWLLGGGKVPPPSREELAKWLLSRMFLSHSNSPRGEPLGSNGWTLLIGDEAREVHAADSGEWPAYSPNAAGEDPGNDLDGFTRAPSRGGGLHLQSTGEESDEESPPSYDAAAFAPDSPLFRRRSSVSDHQFDVPGPFAGEHAGDQDAPQLIDQADTLQHSITPQRKKRWEEDAATGPFSSKDRAGHESTEPASAGDASRSRIPTMSPLKLEPATLRLRSRSSSLVLEPNEWTEDRRRFQAEMTASKRDIERAKLEKAKAERVAELRTQQLLARGRKRVERSRQRQRDAESVKQLVADTLEYHSIRLDVDAQSKQTEIAAKREHERLSQCFRVASGRSERWRKGAVIGPGPLSQRELDLRSSQPTLPVRTVYDLHGRRHSVSDAGKVAAESDLESAMRKLQRSLVDSGKALEFFRLYDRDRTGALSYSELRRLLHERCATTLTDEQSEALFRHLDPNRSGEIDYGELLWGFFNRRAFLKRWEQKRRGRSDRDVKMLFFRYDRTGRGALTAPDFLLALDDLGFRVNDEEAKLLCMKFDANGDGFIDYHEFCAFVGGNDGDSTQEELGRAPRPSRRRSLPSPGSSGNNTSAKSRTVTGPDVDMEQLLAELHELQATQTQIQRHLSTYQ